MCSRLVEETGRSSGWLVGGRGKEEKKRLELRGAGWHRA